MSLFLKLWVSLCRVLFKLLPLKSFVHKSILPFREFVFERWNFNFLDRVELLTVNEHFLDHLKLFVKLFFLFFKGFLLQLRVSFNLFLIDFEFIVLLLVFCQFWFHNFNVLSLVLELSLQPWYLSLALGVTLFVRFKLFDSFLQVYQFDLMFLVYHCNFSLVFLYVFLQKGNLIWVNLLEICQSHQFLIHWIKLVLQLRYLKGWSAISCPVLNVIFLQLCRLSLFFSKPFLYNLKLTPNAVILNLKRLLLLFVVLGLCLQCLIDFFEFSIFML